MALNDPQLPYGLRDVKLTPINSDGSLGTPVDLPVAQTLSFSEAEEFEELRGDDRLVAVHGQGPTCEFDLEAGGISLEAWQVMTGGELDETGVTPTQTKSLTKYTTQSRPYFQIEGQSINDVDGDTHVIIYKAKVTESLEGEFADGTFFVTSCSGQGLGDADDRLYKITWNETAAGIAGGVDEVQTIISTGTGGTFTITYSGQTTSALDWDSTAQEVEDALVALSNLAPGDVEVSGEPGAWSVKFGGTLAATNVALMTLGIGSLTGGVALVQVTQQGAAA
jgi:hypothetical protein